MKHMLLLLVCGLATQYAAALDCVCVMTSCFTCPLNIRSGPSTSNPIIGEAYPNECMVSLDNCPGGWCQVEFNGQTAYTSQSYLSGPQICGHPSTGNCFGSYCGSSSPVGRECDAYGCGHYGADRGSRLHYGSDVACSSNQPLYAPFNGYVQYPVPPYGDGTCCDDGFDFISNDPDWPGYRMRVFYADGYSTGQQVPAGGQIGTHIGLHCGCYPTSMTDHSHVEIYKDDVRIDPTSFLYCNFL